MLFFWLILIQLGIFLGLVVFLRVIMMRNISRATTHLNDINRDYTERLEDAQRRLQEAEKNYDETVLKAKVDAEKMKSQILKDARLSQEAILDDTRKQSELILESANRAKDNLLEEMEQKVDEKATDKSCVLLLEILPQIMTKEMHSRWVEELSKHGLEELDRLNLQDSIEVINLSTAFPLSVEQKNFIQKKLKEKIGRDLKLQEEIQPDLVAGLKMTLGSIVIDGSLKFKIREIQRRVKRGL